MVESKTCVLESDIVVKTPIDIFRDEKRLDAVREGIKKALTKGLYEQGVDFEIGDLRLNAK